VTFEDAKVFEMPFGKHKDKTLDQIAQEERGLQYLDWLRGVRSEDGKHTDVDKALATYLDDPSIQSELENE